jgi:hypothetical protein
MRSRNSSGMESVAKARMASIELDGLTILRLLGVGGVTALCLLVGYGVAWLVEWIWNS